LHPRSLSHCRRGYVLVYFAMLTFVLMAVASLVIDVGFAFITRRQMQTAVGSAALEGLRFRDSVPLQWKDPTNSGQLDSSIITAMQGEGLDPSNLDNVRRWAAQQNVVNTFDDNLNPTDGDPSNFGAGPVVNFTESPGVPPSGQAIAASQTISPGTPTVYKPSDLKWPFQINPNNDVMGDMVSGSYTFNPLNYAPSTSRVEDENYNRTDFQAGTTSPANSFLVRMKRSNEPPNNAPISSSGPPIPYLFGRGSLLTTQQQGGNTVWAKSQGITVRATSIADARPAMAVGPSLPVLNPSTNTFTSSLGLAPFEIDYTYWQNLQTDTVQINTNTGQITSQTSGAVAGQMIRLTALSNSQVGPSDNSIQVKSASGFPNSAPFTIRIDDELMSVVNSTVSGNGSATWSVTRGVDGTTPASHNGNASVNLIDIASVGQSTQQPTIVGSILGSSANGLASTGPQAVQHALAGTFVPIFVFNDPTSRQAVHRIVGFGQAYLTVTPSSTGGSPTVTITKQPSSIASQNVTVRYIPPSDAITEDELNAILGPSGYYSQFRANPQPFAPLLAPALVRSE
jgi:hypothetical protein